MSEAVPKGPAEGGGGGGVKQNKGLEAARKKKYLKIIIPVVACLLLAGAGLAVVFAFLLGSPPCQKYLELVAAGEDVSEAGLTAVRMRSCLLNTCDFDISSCPTSCPFGYHTDDKKGCPVDCNCAVDGVFQGDIGFRSEEVSKMLSDFDHVDEKKDFSLFFGSIFTIFDNLEVDGRFKVPYSLDPTVLPLEKEVFEKTVKNMSEYTCIDFVPRTEERDHIHVGKRGYTCIASVGRNGGKQSLQLPQGCFVEPTVQHQLYHTLGFYHEQTRPDRDGYVDIFKDNIIQGQDYNFDKMARSTLKVLGSEYELQSGVHYQSYDFAKDPSIPTITGKKDVILDVPVQELFLTLEDFNELNLLYDCRMPTEKKSGIWGTWQEWSDCTETCGAGKKTRFRKCYSGAEELKGGCGPVDREEKPCNDQECEPKGGAWAEWLTWLPCSHTCGNGKRFRYRVCDPIGTCEGLQWQFEDCYLTFCDSGRPVASRMFGQWSDWESWRRCDVTCGSGQRLRYRDCMKGTEKLNTKMCRGLPADGIIFENNQQQSLPCEAETSCSTLLTLAPTSNPFWTSTTQKTAETSSTPDPFETPAPTGAGYFEWSDWGPWNFCDATCGFGILTRKRKCGGVYCAGDSVSHSKCDAGPCVGEGLFQETTSITSNVCIYGKLLVGRFNKDVYEDLICVYPDGSVRVYVSDASTKNYIPDFVNWERQTDVCSFVGEKIGDEVRIFASDVDGDGLDDLICVNDITKEIEVTLNSETGYSALVDWRGKRDECVEAVAVLDVTGDRKADLLCGDHQIAFKHVFENIKDDPASFLTKL